MIGRYALSLNFPIIQPCPLQGSSLHPCQAQLKFIKMGVDEEAVPVGQIYFIDVCLNPVATYRPLKVIRDYTI